MLLRLNDIGVPMKMVYKLSEDLKNNPERIALTQALTLDKSRPSMGLKGAFGLFGSQDWWENIKQGKMPMLFISGIVRRVYSAGQDELAANNTVDLVLSDGSVRAVGIYVNDRNDIDFIRIGCRVDIAYALDELKQQPAVDGGINYSKVALEMAVSLQPIE
jgi:hypothetical protein